MSVCEDEFVIKLYKKRWFMLFIFIFVSLSNSYQWIHLNIISDRLLIILNVSIPNSSVENRQIAIDWLSMVYMIAYIPLLIPSTWVLNKWGLKVVLLCANFLNFTGALVKLLSFLLVKYPTTPITYDHSFPLLMLGQTLCGIAQIFILGIPAHLSAVWFGENEIATATCLGVFGNQVGVSIGFVLPPLIVPIIQASTNLAEFNVTKNCFLHLMYFTVVFTCLPFILTIFFFKNKPATEPSFSQFKRNRISVNEKTLSEISVSSNNNQYYEEYSHANNNKALNSHNNKNGNNNNNTGNGDKGDTFDSVGLKKQQTDAGQNNIKKSLKNLCCNPGFVLLLISYGINTGVFYAIGTLLNYYLLDHFQNGVLIGWAGFTMVLAGIIGSILMGIILDRTKKYRLVICAVYILSLIWMGIFTGIANTSFMVLVFICMFFLGFFMTGYLALGFEYAAELTYPESEGLTSGLLNISAQVFGILLIVIGNKLKSAYNTLVGNLFFVALLAIGSVLTLAIKEDLRRQRQLQVFRDLNCDKTSDLSREEVEH